MKILIVAANESRDRQKYVSDPLIQGGHEVDVLKIDPLKKYIKKIFTINTFKSYDIVVLMGVGVKFYLAFWIATYLNLPCFVRLGGNPVRDYQSNAINYYKKRLYKTFLKFTIKKYLACFLLKKIRFLIVVNPYLGRDLISSLDKDCTIFHIPQYSEGDLVKKAYDLNSPVEILSVSNLEFVEKANGVIWLIKSLNEFCVKNKVKINFKVAGNGISKKDVDIFLKEKQLSKFLNVKMLGFVSSLDHFYEKADVFLYRSFHDATPNVILESKRYGLPLIVNYSEEFSLIVDHDVNGCLYKNKNEFFNYLYDIVFDKQLRVRLGENAQNDFTKKYSVAAVAELFEHVFRDFKFESKI